MAKFKGRSVKLNKPFRTPGRSKKFGVYVRNKATGKVNIVRFGDPNLSIKSKPRKVKMIIITPINTELNKDAFVPKPAISRISGA